MSKRERRIQEIAYHLWEKEGRPHGHSERFWHAAEAQVEAEIAQPVDPSSGTAVEKPARPASRKAEPAAEKSPPSRSRSAEPAPPKLEKPETKKPEKKAGAIKPKAVEPAPPKPAGGSARRKPSGTMFGRCVFVVALA